MADKIDQLKIGSTSYDIDLPPDASPSIASLTVSGATSIGGTLTLTKTQDLGGTANNSPALIIGGAATAEHIEIDSNEIHAKANGTTVGPLYLNNDGGNVYLGGSNAYSSGGKLYSNGSVVINSGDVSSAGNAASGKVVSRNAAGSIQTEKLAVSSGTTTKATMQYNTTEDCIEFIFA